MVYQGSKNKIAKDIVPVIENYLSSFNDPSTVYIEPFVGGANMIDKINWDIKYGYDIMSPLISLHKEAQEQVKLNKEILPCDYSREAYNQVRQDYNDKLPTTALMGHYGYLMSYNGRFFDGGYGVFDSNGRNLYLSRLKNLNKQIQNPQYQNIIFNHLDYKDINLESNLNYVIYLDPPYKNTKQYKVSFNHNELWAKCKEWKEQNPNVIILLSELEAPASWKCIWEKDHQYTLRDRNNKNKKVIEKLFIYEGE